MADHYRKSTQSPPPVRISVSASIGENAADLSLVLNVGWVRDGKLNVAEPRSANLVPAKPTSCAP
jgi:hypothetical protein